VFLWLDRFNNLIYLSILLPVSRDFAGTFFYLALLLQRSHIELSEIVVAMVNFRKQRAVRRQRYEAAKRHKGGTVHTLN
jgi:hypothetical protein